MSRLIITSNRLPVSAVREEGKLTYHESVGGVATGIASLTEPKERVWFGWPGLPSDNLSDAEQAEVTAELNHRGCHPVFLSSENIRDFYSGFSNMTIWPLFHYFNQFAVFDDSYWQAYKDVNQLFGKVIIPHLKPDDIIWIHDYQLMLLPQLIREQLPDVKIGFFLHIPFPSFELLRNLPWRSEILDGILGADLVGFHEYDYVRHFLSSVYRISGHEHQLSQLTIGRRRIRVDAFPMGINYEKYASGAAEPAVQSEIDTFRKNDVKIILSVDRLDYTKGMFKRLEAYDQFLSENPQYHGRVSLAMVAVPSRTKVEQYALLREEVEQQVGRINGNYGDLDWTPISYIYRSLPFEKISALYNVADVALITPLRDGMNLVAKEFVATQKDKAEQGILILSEMAGAASELSEAIAINPYDKSGVVQAIKDALEMPQEERLRRNLLMQTRLSRYTVGRWASDFIESLDEIKKVQNNMVPKRFVRCLQDKAVEQYRRAERRLILLDYDGTLKPFVKLPQQAKPGVKLLSLLEHLCEQPANELVIISGRDCETLEKWLGHLPLNLVSEHGAFYRKKNKEWQSTVQEGEDWKEVIYPVLELFVDRTPGSFIEEKNSALVWHFRKSELDLAKLRTQELKDVLVMMATNFNLGVYEGHRIIEVKPVSINKGQAVQEWLSRDDWSFVFCAGDDYTDEDMFAALPKMTISCKIGSGPSNAQYRLASPQELLEFLEMLA